MAPRPYFDHGLLWRAILISLLVHAWFLLQPEFTQDSPSAQVPRFLTAMLKPIAENGALKGSTVTGMSPSVRHEPTPAQDIGLVKADKAPAIPREAPPVATEIPQSNGMPEIKEVTRGREVTSAISANGADFDVVEEKKSYLLAIAAEARQVKKYPQRAFAAGWTGTAEIRIAVARGGIVKSPQLLKSSGHADIDEAALLFVGIALKHTPVPENLRASDFELTLPVSFSIKDQ